MSKYRLENLSITDLKRYAYFCEGMMKIQKEVGKGVIEHLFIDELMQELTEREYHKKVDRLRNI